VSALVAWALAKLAGLLPTASSSPVVVAAGASVTAGDVRAAIAALEAFHVAAWKDAFASRLSNVADDEVVAGDVLAAVAAIDPALAGDVAIARVILAVAPYAVTAGEAAGFSPTRAGEESLDAIAAAEVAEGKRK
jgi:hypothetical protein